MSIGVNFAAGMAGSLTEQKIAKGHISPVRAAVDGVFNAIGGRLYGTSPLRNAKNAFIRGAFEGAVKGGAYNIADVLDNKLRNARRKKHKTRVPYNLAGIHPTRGRSPQQSCEKQRPLNGMYHPNKGGRGGSFPLGDDKFRFGDFVWDTISGAVLGGLASVMFYRAGKVVEVLEQSVQQRYLPVQNERRVCEKKPLIEYDLQFFAEKRRNNYRSILNVGAGDNPIPCAKNIDINPRSLGGIYGNANNLHEFDSDQFDHIIALHPYRYDILDSDVPRVLKNGGILTVVGNISNKYLKKIYKMTSETLQDNGFEIKYKGNAGSAFIKYGGKVTS